MSIFRKDKSEEEEKSEEEKLALKVVETAKTDSAPGIRAIVAALAVTVEENKKEIERLKSKWN